MQTRRWVLGVAALCTWLSGAARADCPPRQTWPNPDWPDDTARTPITRAAAISALEDYAFTLQGKDVDRKGRRTDGMVIIQGGRLVYEKYARGYDATRPHLTWSVSKSLTSALTGVAVGQGRMHVSDSVCAYRSYNNQDICRVTIEHLITFGSGLEWSETYENDLPRASSVGAMLYGEGREDMAEFVAGHPFRADPGTLWNYSSGDSMLLASAVAAVLKPVHGVGFAHTLLFNKLGMKKSSLERDQKGNFVGSSYWYAPPREMARLGYLYLNDGCWEGERILPAGWVHQSLVPSEVFKKDRRQAAADDVLGYSWYLNVPVPEAGVGKPYPDVPDDMFAARGHWGQSITVVPSWDVVIVRVGDDRDTGITDFNELIKRALEVVP